MTDATFWTAHIVHGSEEHIPLYDDTREVIVTAIAGDVYVSPQATTHPPALDTMSSENTWLGAIVLDGTTRCFKIRVEDLGASGGLLYFGPVTASSGACTVSVIASRQED